jgi:hypothetical protein
MINISNVLTSFMSISNSELKKTLTTFTQSNTELLEKIVPQLLSKRHAFYAGTRGLIHHSLPLYTILILVNILRIRPSVTVRYILILYSGMHKSHLPSRRGK